MGLVRTIKCDQSMYIIPLDAISLNDIIIITNVTRTFSSPLNNPRQERTIEKPRSARLNVTANGGYHIAPQEHVDLAGGIEKYFQSRSWESIK